MVSDLVRGWSARLTLPLARFLAGLGLTPNIVTVLGFLLTAAVAGVLATGHLQLAGFLLILSLGADAIDGVLARATGATTRFGAFLDSTLDRWAEVLIYLALMSVLLRKASDGAVLLCAAAMASSLLVSYTRARAEGVGLKCKEGLFTRFERLLVLIAGLIFGQTIIALWVIAVLATLTAIQRVWVTWQADQGSK